MNLFELSDDESKALVTTGQLFRVVKLEGSGSFGTIKIETVPNVIDPRSRLDIIMEEGFARIDAIFNEAIERLDDLKKTYDVGFYGYLGDQEIGRISFSAFQQAEQAFHTIRLNNLLIARPIMTNKEEKTLLQRWFNRAR